MPCRNDAAYDPAMPGPRESDSCSPAAPRRLLIREQVTGGHRIVSDDRLRSCWLDAAVRSPAGSPSAGLGPRSVPKAQRPVPVEATSGAAAPSSAASSRHLLRPWPRDRAAWLKSRSRRPAGSAAITPQSLTAPVRRQLLPFALKQGGIMSALGRRTTALRGGRRNRHRAGCRSASLRR